MKTWVLPGWKTAVVNEQAAFPVGQKKKKCVTGSQN